MLNDLFIDDKERNKCTVVPDSVDWWRSRIKKWKEWFILNLFVLIMHEGRNQKDFVEIMPPRTPKMFSFTVSSMVSPICLFGSNFPVFLMAISFFVFFVSSSMRFAHSTAHFATFSKFSWLCSVISVWSFSFSPSFHFCLYKFNNIFWSSSFVL